MFKLREAKHKKRNLSDGSIRRAHTSHSAKKPSRAQRLFTSLLAGGIVLGVLMGAGYAVYSSILNNALQISEPKMLLLVPENVENQEHVLFVYLAPEREDSYMVSIAGTQEVVLPAGYGKYRLGAIYQLLKIDNRDDQFITASFSRSVGRVLDTVYALDSVDQKGSVFTSNLFGKITDFIWLKRTIPRDLVKLWHFSKDSLPVAHVRSVEELHTVLDAKKKEEYISSECQISILNGGEMTGAATALTQLFEDSGLLTIRTSSYSQIEPTTTIFYSPKPGCEQPLSMVKNVFVKQPHLVEDEQMTTQYRAPIVVILGQDFE